MNQIEIPEEIDISALFGSFDSNMKLLEKSLGVSITSRDNKIKINGDEDACEKAEKVFKALIDIIERVSGSTSRRFSMP